MKKIVGFGLLFFFMFLIVPLFHSTYALSDIVKISNSSTDVVFPQLTTDSNGYLHLVWMDVEPNTVWAGYANPGIFYSRWNGDTWSAPIEISENTGFAEIPAVAVDNSDTLHVVWDDETYGTEFSKVAYKTRNSTGTWSSIEAIPYPADGTFSWNSRIAVDGSDVPHVVFASDTGIYWSQKVAGNWTVPVLVSTNASNVGLADSWWSDIKEDVSGNIHLIYWSSSQGIFYRSYSAGVWSTPVNVTTNGDIEYTRMVTSSNNEVFTTWYQRDGTIHTRWTQGGVWQADTTLATGATISNWGFPIMGITSDSKGRVHIGWGEEDEGDGLIDLKYKSFVSGVWGAAQNVDLDNQDADSPYVFPDKWDNQHFAWAERNASTGRWEIMYRVAEGTIQSVTTAGGTVTVNPNNITYATLTFPSNALSSTQNIAVQIGPVPENVDQNQVTLPRAITFRPHGITFNSSVTAQIFYTEAEIAGADERDLQPWFWDSTANGGLGDWVIQNGQNRPSQNRIDVSLTHFSLYGISAPKVVTTWIKPDTGFVGTTNSVNFKFSMKYADGRDILPPATPDELIVKLKDSNGLEKKVMMFEKGVIKETGKGNYFGKIDLKDGIYPNGEYILEAYLASGLMSTQSITILR